MPVSTPHSSRNTRRSGAIPPTPASASAGHAARAAATSARPCSAACRLCLFHVQPHRRSARPTVQGCTRTPVRSASRSRHSERTGRSEEHTSELQSHVNLVCRLLLEKKKKKKKNKLLQSHKYTYLRI